MDNRVAFVGDTHANIGSTLQVIEEVRRRGVKTIVQVGDFGFYPRIPRGLTFLNTVSEACQKAKIEFHWVDGNHEDHQSLPHDATEPRELRPNVIWHPRGTITELHGKRFMWMGGAVSVDKYARIPGYDWFETEIPSEEQWFRALEAGKADIMISHDAPQGVNLIGMPWVIDELVRASELMRARLRSVLESCGARLSIHGHWHQAHRTMVGDTMVIGLAEDGSDIWDQVTILDLDDFENAFVEAVSTEPRPYIWDEPARLESEEE